jgi:hypothetical protein
MHRRSRLVFSSACVALSGILLIACAAPGNPDQAATASPTSSPTTVESPSATPTPEMQIVRVTLDGLSLGDGSTVAYDVPNEVIAALTDALDSSPIEESVEGVYGSIHTTFTWGGVRATVWDPQSLTLKVAAVTPGTTFTTEEGIALGSTRAEAMAAGAEDLWDQDGDGVADLLMLGMREVPGTSSLVNPGQVGVEYLTLTVVGDVVTAIDSQGNDFSDI